MALNRAKTRSLVEKFMRAGRLDAAVKELQKLADDNPRDVQVLNQIGNLEMRLGNKETAVRLFLKVADLYHKDGFATKAVASLKIATREDPENIEAWKMLAELSEKQGFSLEARAAYERVVKLLEKTGDLQEMVNIQKKLLGLDPNNIKARVQLGDNLIQLKKTKDGIKQYVSAAKQLVVQGHQKEAALLIDRAIELEPETLRFLETLIKELIEKKQASMAVGILDQLIEKHPNTESLLLLEIECLVMEQQNAKAVEACRKLLNFRPGSAQAAIRLVRLLLGDSKFDDTAVFLDGWLEHCEEAKYPEAEALFQEVLRFNPQHIRTLSGLAKLYRLNGNKAGLISTLESKYKAAHEEGSTNDEESALKELVDLQPDNPGYRKKLEKLSGGGTGKVEAPEESVSVVEETGEVEIEIEASDLELETPDVTSSLSNKPLTNSEPEEVTEIEAVDEIEEIEEAEEPDSGKHERKKLDASEVQTIREQLTEAEVFLKYGFADKAISELQSVLKKVPDHVHAHQKLIAIFKQQKKKGKIVSQLLKLARVFRENNDDETCESLLDEAREIDPNNKAIAAFLSDEPSQEIDAQMLEVKKSLEKGSGKAPQELDLGLLVPVSEDEAPKKSEEDEIEVDIDLEEEADLQEENSESLDEVEEVVPPAAEDEDSEDVSGEFGEEPKEPVEEEGLPVEESLDIAISADETEADELKDKLEEAEFYLSQELIGEARRVFDEIEKKWPDEDRVTDFRERLEAQAEKGSKTEPPQVEIIEEGEPEAEPVEEEAAEIEDEPVESEPEVPVAEEADEAPAEMEEEAAPVPEKELEESGSKEIRRSRTKMKVTLSELLPEGIIEQDEESLRGSSSEDSSEFYDLASELGAALDGLQGEEEELFDEDEKSPEEMSFEEVFEEFKKGVEKKIGEEDYSTHYNLGIAYKEMELLDEAIGEFQIAARSPEYAIECCSMLGLCFRQKEMPELAEKWYRRGIEAPGFSEDAYVGLKYDLAETLEGQGRKDEAIKLYKEVYAINANHRDVASKVKGEG